MAISIESFRSQFSGQGYRTNLFEVQGSFPTPGSDDNRLAFMVRGAQLPASNLGIVEVPFRGRTLKLPGDRSFDDWTITVIMDNFGIRDSFERWSNAINSMANNRSLGFTQVRKPDSDSYLRNWTVQALGRDGRKLKTYTIVGCFPSSIGAVDLSADSTTTVGEFTVTMSYQYWVSNTTDGQKDNPEPAAESSTQ